MDLWVKTPAERNTNSMNMRFSSVIYGQIKSAADTIVAPATLSRALSEELTIPHAPP
jgi:hypothetical protein